MHCYWKKGPLANELDILTQLQVSMVLMTSQMTKMQLDKGKRPTVIKCYNGICLGLSLPLVVLELIVDYKNRKALYKRLF